MPFFEFIQNNSGGNYKTSKNGVTSYVIIEAKDSFFANAKAKSLGIYFNGISKGRDCSCCGDRWRKVDESDATDKPTIYGLPVEPFGADWVDLVFSDDDLDDREFKNALPTAIHYLNSESPVWAGAPDTDC